MKRIYWIGSRSNELPSVANRIERIVRGFQEAVTALYHYLHQEYVQVVDNAILALISNPTSLQNRGLLSITARSKINFLQTPQ
jgi:hypothetical protein